MQPHGSASRLGGLLTANTRKGTIALTLALLILGSFIFPTSVGVQPVRAASAPVATTTPAPLPTFTLASSNTVLGPTWHVDTTFHTVGSAPNLLGYVSNTM